MRDIRTMKNPVQVNCGRLIVLLLGGAAFLFAYLALAPVAQRATSATPNKPLHVYHMQGDQFSTYDFEEETYKPGKVDFAVDLIFAHGGTVSRVKEQLDDDFPWTKRSIDLPGFDPKEYGNSTNYARVNDGPEGSGGEWDQDAGNKTSGCQTKEEPNTYHFRVYAPEDVDHFVNQKWGNYIIGTAHVDHNECPPAYSGGHDGTPKWSGRSEKSERMVAYYSTQDFDNAKVFPDKVWLDNYEPRDESTNHYWLNDGRATFINVSGK